MVVDLTGGLDIERERVFEIPPDTPLMRDAVNMWLWDDSGWVGLPRIAVEAIAPDWSTHTIQMTAAFPDKRALRNYGAGPAHSPNGPHGRGTVLGAGPISFECVEPYKRYRARYDGPTMDTNYDIALKGEPTDRFASLFLDIECEAVVPPWVQGTMSMDAAQILSGTKEADFMGGERLEQMLRAKGVVRIDGVERAFSGGGLRVKRQGIRKVEGFWGHCWQSGLFPSGRAFGHNAYPPRPDGVATYSEGYVFFGDGPLVPAKGIAPPFLTRMTFEGEDVGIELETSKGRVKIEGRTIISVPSVASAKQQKMVDAINFPPLLQSIVRWVWDGEVGYGMLERSNLAERVEGLDRV